MATTTSDDPKDIPHVVREAEKALHAWKALVQAEKENAEDLNWYAEELWCEDKHKWASGKRKVLRKEWTVEHFDDEMKMLKDKQEPVWDQLIDKAADLRAKLELPYERVKHSRQAIKEAMIDPNAKFLHPFVKLFAVKDTPERKELKHEYHQKLSKEFQEADGLFEAICGYPDGLLTRVRELRVHAEKENAHLLEVVHNKKGLTHVEEAAPEAAPAGDAPPEVADKEELVAPKADVPEVTAPEDVIEQ